MKTRIASGAVLLVLALCLAGCEKKRTDLPGGEEIPVETDRLPMRTADECSILLK